MIIILQTKLLIPSFGERHFLERPDLFKWLNEGLKTKLTFVKAPPGFGKTTALSLWAKPCNCAVGWVSLDRIDNDPIRFWSYVIEAVRGGFPKFGVKSAAQLTSFSVDTFRRFIDTLLNEFNTLSGELALILDDIHVIDLESIWESIAYLLEYLPPNIHLYMASRTAAPFPTARLLAKGDMQSITAKELRFQLEDGIRYFRDCMQLELPDEVAAMFVDRTDGWVSGLHLAALSLRNHADPSTFIRGFGGQHHDIAQYLLEEVLERQTEEIKNFLMKTSVLSRMNASLCQAVTGQRNAQLLLELLERQQLFITKLDERGEWYRYHPMFAEFLQQQCRRMLLEQWGPIHTMAAQWLEENGSLVESVEHWILGGQHTEAAVRIEQHLPALQDHRSSLVRWLEAMPKQTLRKRPLLQLLYLKVMTEAGQSRWVDQQLRGLEGELSEEDWKPWIGSYYYLSAETALYCRDVPRSLQYLELFDQYEPSVQTSPLQMIAGNTIAGVNFESLLSFFDRFHEAENYFLTCIRIWEGKGASPFLGYLYCFYSQLLYEWNRLEEAEALVNRVRDHSQWVPYARILFLATEILALIRLRTGKAAEAFAMMEQMKDQLNTTEKELFIRRLESDKAYFSIYGGLTDQIHIWIGSCGLKYTDSVPPFYREHYILARSLIQVGHVSEALVLLEDLFRITRQKGWLWDQVKVMIFQCIALERSGKEEEALIKLEETIYLAEPQGYVRSFLDEGEALGALLVRYLHRRQTRSIRVSWPASLPYVKRLLNKMNIQLEGALAVRSVLTEQELRILRLVEQGFKNREMAESLGISSETVKKHIKNMYLKLDAHSRVQAVAIAKELRLL